MLQISYSIFLTIVKKTKTYNVEFISDISKTKTLLDALSSQGKTIGFVPTMGALHEGHISLIELAKVKSDYVVCSIFVNPTQFNEKSDYEKYPNTLEADRKMLEAAGCNLLFAPSLDAIYPAGVIRKTPFDYSPLDKVMEATHRPGHFDGMAQIVKILLEIVRPQFLFMGQKDFQQQLIVKKLVKWMNIDTQVITCPIIREANGLAMSSRNRRLSAEQRAEAGIISKALFSTAAALENLARAGVLKNEENKADAELMIMGKQIEELESVAEKLITESGNIKLEYFEIADIENLNRLRKIKLPDSIVICTAVRMGEIRLIDNVMVNLNQ